MLFIKAVSGDGHPVHVYKGTERYAGWHNTTLTGDSVSFADTYNDTADVELTGNTLQAVTVETITTPVSDYIIPFLCSGGVFDMQISGVTSYKWIYNGVTYLQSRLQLTTQNNDVVWLLVSGTFNATNTLSSNWINNALKMDLLDLQGKITYQLVLTSPLVTGSLADLQGKITYYLYLTSPLVTGSLADLQGKITFLLHLTSPLVTGSLADLQGKITYYLYLTSPLVTGSLMPHPEMRYILLRYCTGISKEDIDATIINTNNVTTAAGARELTITGLNRTAASTDAVAGLRTKGWTVNDGVIV